jgi:hypothetical protein
MLEVNATAGSLCRLQPGYVKFIGAANFLPTALDWQALVLASSILSPFLKMTVEIANLATTYVFAEVLSTLWSSSRFAG